jgi:hypothetical protein
MGNISQEAISHAKAQRAQRRKGALKSNFASLRLCAFALKTYFSDSYSLRASTSTGKS